MPKEDERVVLTCGLTQDGIQFVLVNDVIAFLFERGMAREDITEFASRTRKAGNDLRAVREAAKAKELERDKEYKEKMEKREEKKKK